MPTTQPFPPLMGAGAPVPVLEREGHVCPCVSLALPHYRTQGWLLSFRQYFSKFCVSHMGRRALVFTGSHPALGPGHSGPPSLFQMPRVLGFRKAFHPLPHGLGEEAALALCFGARFYVSVLGLQFCF